MNFIYVMQENDRDKLIELGYTLVKEDLHNHVWIFNNSSSIFSSEGELEKFGIQFVASNILTF